jgi:hypothetical protein
MTYSPRNPKYRELYSRIPPSMAPSRLDDITTMIEFARFNSSEKASPEKKRGAARTTVASGNEFFKLPEAAIAGK